MGLLFGLAVLLGIGLFALGAQAKNAPGTSPPKPGEPEKQPSVVTDLFPGKLYALNVMATKGTAPEALARMVLGITAAQVNPGAAATTFRAMPVFSGAGKLPVIGKSDINMGGVLVDQWIFPVVVASPQIKDWKITLPLTLPNTTFSVQSAVDLSQTPEAPRGAGPGLVFPPSPTPSGMTVETGKRYAFVVQFPPAANVPSATVNALLTAQGFQLSNLIDQGSGLWQGVGLMTGPSQMLMNSQAAVWQLLREVPIAPTAAPLVKKVSPATASG